MLRVFKIEKTAAASVEEIIEPKSRAHTNDIFNIKEINTAVIVAVNRTPTVAKTRRV